MQVSVTEVTPGTYINYRGNRAKVTLIESTGNDSIKFTLELFDEDLISKVYSIISSVEVLPEKPVEWATNIDIKTIPFELWFSISSAMKTYPNVAVARWVENTHDELLAKLTLKDWMDIAETAGFSSAWASKNHAMAQGY